MRSLYRCIDKYIKDRNNLQQTYIDSGGKMDGQDFLADSAELQSALLDEIQRHYIKNIIVRDHVNGYRSADETIEEYTMHDDMILPGTETKPMKNMSKYIGMITGVGRPLSPPFLGSSRSKISRVRGRGKIVSMMLDKQKNKILALTTERLPSSYEIPERRRPVRDYLNGWIDRLVDDWNGD